jgi:hypothetical protein
MSEASFPYLNEFQSTKAFTRQLLLVIEESMKVRATTNYNFYWKKEQNKNNFSSYSIVWER